MAKKVGKWQTQNIGRKFLLLRTQSVNSGSHMPPSYLRLRRPLELKTSVDLFQWVSGASAMDYRRTKIGAKCKSNWRMQFSTIPLFIKSILKSLVILAM